MLSINESCHTYEESCHTYEWVMSHIWITRRRDGSRAFWCIYMCLFRYIYIWTRRRLIRRANPLLYYSEFLSVLVIALIVKQREAHPLRYLSYLCLTYIFFSCSGHRSIRRVHVARPLRYFNSIGFPFIFLFFFFLLDHRSTRGVWVARPPSVP